MGVVAGIATLDRAVVGVVEVAGEVVEADGERGPEVRARVEFDLGVRGGRVEQVVPVLALALTDAVRRVVALLVRGLREVLGPDGVDRADAGRLGEPVQARARAVDAALVEVASLAARGEAELGEPDEVLLDTIPEHQEPEVL